MAFQYVADAKVNFRTPYIALTDDVTAMDDYVRSEQGRAALDRGLSDIADSRAQSSQTRISTTLNGVVYELNWIFFRHDDAEIEFIHIVDSRRDKRTIRF